MSLASVLLVLAALLFFMLSGILRQKRRGDDVIVRVRRYGTAEVYHYFLPGRSVPSATYERGSYQINLVSSAGNTPVMLCCGNPELAIRGKEEMKLLAGALAHISKMDRYI